MSNFNNTDDFLQIGNYKIKNKYSYLQYPRVKVTTNIRKGYYESYKQFMDAINKNYSIGFDVLISMLEDEEFREVFIDKIKKY